MAGSIWTLLDEVRSLAQMGLYYSKDEYDLKRYRRLLELAAGEYTALSDLPSGLVLERLQQEVGQVTPKVGVNGLVLTDDGRVLLERRADDGLWGLPGGWAEIGESPQQTVIREIKEETGLDVETAGIVDVFSRLPGDYSQPHTSYHILFSCRIIGGELAKSEESLEIGFYDYRAIEDWHREHREMVERGMARDLS